MLHVVTIPRLNANEDEVLVAEILPGVGDFVSAGQEVLVLETAKAAVSVEAEVSGHVRLVLAAAGRTARVGAVALVLSDAAAEPLGQWEPTVEGGPGPEAPSAPRTTAKERLLARAPRGRGAAREAAPCAPAWTPDPVPSAELDFVLRARAALAALDPLPEGAAPVELGPGSAGCGPGWSVAPGAAIAPGARIVARRVVLAEGAVVGEGTRIEADAVYLGPQAKVGARTGVVTGELVAADGAYIGEGVDVDLGGGRSAESRLLVGRAGLVSPRCFVNTCREVVLEDESALSPGAYVFTHRFWQSVLDGYTVAFAGVRLCADAWVGSGCQVLPGVVVGAGAVVMSNSTVAGPVPPECMAAGVPAVVVRRGLRRELVAADKDGIVRDILREFAGHLAFKGCTVRAQGDSLEVGLADGTRRTVVFLPHEARGGHGAQAAPAPGSVVLAFGPLPGAGTGCSVFDLAAREFSGPQDRLVHELRNFLRRRGLRFAPFAWDGGFRHGL